MISSALSSQLIRHIPLFILGQVQLKLMKNLRFTPLLVMLQVACKDIHYPSSKLK